MRSSKPKALIRVSYEAWAQEYLRNLPLEHFMESTTQAGQREITLESLALVAARRSDFHVYNELLVQYPRRGQKRPGQVVPDNMVVVTKKPIEAETSYNLPLEPVRPFWVLEYVSKSNKRKDYDDNFDKYEKELKVPYYLLFNPEAQELTLYRHDGTQYISVKPNQHGRYPIEELELEMALLDGWVRYWYQGKLLPLPADLQRQLDTAQEQAKQEKQRAEQEKQRADTLQRELEREQEARRALERELAELRGQAAPARPRRPNGPKGPNG
jgi:Uma2 family endonuclease